MFGKKLSRQLKKTFLEADFTSNLEAWKNSLNALPEFSEKEQMVGFFDSFSEFLDLVDETYKEGDAKVELVERNLEVSSVELTEANTSLHQLNTTFDAMLNSLGQGFFIFDIKKTCLSIYSKACEKIILTKPAGKKVSDVLKIHEKEVTAFDDWCELLFQDLIDFDDLAALGPQLLDDPNGRVISLEYRAVRGSDHKVNYILVIATDRTAEVSAQQKAEELQAHVTFLASALKDRDQFRRYVAESRRLFRECVNIVRADILTAEQIRVLSLNLHTLKGAAGTFGVVRVKDEINDIESKLKECRTPDEIKNLLNEMISQVVQRFENTLEDNREIVGDMISKSGPKRELELKELVDVANAMRDFNDMRSVYEAFVQRLVSIPADKLIQPFDLTLQTAAKKLKKEIKPLQIDSKDLYLIPENYNEFLSSLVHVFRNIADHGIESPEDRISNGKDPKGKVTVQLRPMPHDKDRFFMLITDDGKGINYNKIRARLRENGFVNEANTSTYAELNEWLFKPGFSTSEKVTEFSGRGVGMDAVKYAVDSLGGQVRLESTPGFGTRMYFELPLIKEVNTDIFRNYNIVDEKPDSETKKVAA